MIVLPKNTIHQVVQPDKKASKFLEHQKRNYRENSKNQHFLFAQVKYIMVFPLICWEFGHVQTIFYLAKIFVQNVLSFICHVFTPSSS